MAKIKWTEEKVRQLEAEGRGKGVGANYKPWVEVTDFSSSGNSRRVFSRKTGRVHHLLSDVEWQLFLLLEFSPNVCDIREQFPLKRAETLSLAAQRGIKHPAYPGTKTPVVMTCDFVVTFMRDGDRSLAAFSCKTDDGADDARKLELLEIERAYFDGTEVPHHLVFASTLPKNKVRNLYWCRGADINIEGSQEYPDALDEHRARIVHELSQQSRLVSLADYCRGYDARTGSPVGTGLRAARALLWERALVTDMNQADLPGCPLSMFHVPPHAGSALREA